MKLVQDKPTKSFRRHSRSTVSLSLSLSLSASPLRTFSIVSQLFLRSALPLRRYLARATFLSFPRIVRGEGKVRGRRREKERTVTHSLRRFVSFSIPNFALSRNEGSSPSVFSLHRPRPFPFTVLHDSGLFTRPFQTLFKAKEVRSTDIPSFFHPVLAFAVPRRWSRSWSFDPFLIAVLSMYISIRSILSTSSFDLQM